jgi:predicted  nucleic acid-binding Zn-ribbon protein
MLRCEKMPDVDQSTLLRLLDLQNEDTAIKRLIERRSSLPEAARLEETNRALAELEADLSIATKNNDEIGLEQKRFEGEIELLEAKRVKEEQRMFSGSVSNPKELAGLQAEVASLKKRQAGMEDQLLEVMEQKEGAQSTLDSLQTERNAKDAEAAELTQTVTRLTTDIGAELSIHQAERDAIAPELPLDLMALYDKLRDAKSGVGAAALQGGTCQGCHTKLPQKEYEAIRAAGGLQRCENCRRILVVV